jgi:hypothetical protein
VETIISQLFAARDIAHRLHLRTRSFAAHLALGDLYERLIDLADELAEVYQGKYGLMDFPNPIFTFSEQDPIIFIRELAQWAENTRAIFNPEDTHLLNEWDSVISTIYRAKYKLENLA